MKAYFDVADLPEDSHISIIVATVIETQKIVGFIVADDADADRYIAKIRSASPQVRIIARGPGPVESTVMVRIGPVGH